MSVKLKYTVKCLLENRLRFVLTVLSISVGVVSILIVNTISTFGVSAVSTELESLGMNGLIVHRELSSASLCDDEVEKITAVEGVEKVAPVTVNTSEVYDNFSSTATSSIVWGVDESTPDVISFEILYGRFIDKGDIKANNKVCIIDKSLANELFSRDNVVGKSVKLLCGSSVEEFEVVGVVQTGKGIMQSLMGTYFPAFLYVPYTAFNNSADYDKLFLKINT
ncbi:MAG: ABC transporter permease, partial [Lachnospiraceae bacterium]|nr:ABC transporter permease [Lachnospiraceae bacterium]